MRLLVEADAEAAAVRAAAEITTAAEAAIEARGRFNLALSGGSTPRRMFEILASSAIDWARVALYQVDERLVPGNHPARNLRELQRSLLSRLDVSPVVHPMPVEADDLAMAAAHYAESLPERFDLIHLGLGADGHTASLVPSDPVLASVARVAVTGEYQGHRRMTLTYPVLNSCRRLLYLVTGADKHWALGRLLEGDIGIPAGRVARDRALVIADRRT